MAAGKTDGERYSIMLLSYQKADGTSAKIRLKAIAHSPEVTIGRGKEAKIVLDDSLCSRIHCSILFWNDLFVIRDVNSSNGTLLNGNKIEVAKLSPGDVIKIGGTEITVIPEASSIEATMKS